MRLKLFLLKRVDRVPYEETAGELIAAASLARALEMSDIRGVEGTQVTHIGPANRNVKAEGILLRDFNNG